MIIDLKIDLEYARKQLKGIDLELLNRGAMNNAEQRNAADRVQRALDAIERLIEAEKATDQA